MADERPESKSERQTLQVLIRELSERGNQPAIVALQEKSIERWSYRKLAVHVSKLARGLIEAGLEGGQHVAMFAENSPEWIVACLAAIEAGGVVVPIDLQLDEETLGHVLTDSEARFVFTTSRACKRLRSVKLDGKLRCILLDADEADKQSWRRLISEKTDKFPTADPNDEAVLFYTSGTTGKPKGVPLSHANLVHQINALIEAKLITENDRALLPLPLHHVYPFAIGMLNSLALGLPIVLPYSLTGPQIVRAIKEGEVTLILGVPRLYRALYSGIESRAKSKGRIAAALFEASLDCCLWLRQRLGLRVGKVLLHPLHQHIGPKIRVMASGGAALDPDLAWKLEALGWRVAIGYGLTETAPLLTLKPPGEGSPDHVGRAISGVELRIDPAAKPGEGERKPSADATREEGEVLARGPNVFRGYRNLPDKTKEAFTGGWFRTGDLGYLDEHEQLHITGRASTMIVTESGKHIQPDDLEKAYLEHPAISEIGVLKQENKLVALIVPKMAKAEDQGGKAAQAVREAMKQTSGKLASYQRISEYAITSDPLPRTRLGKIQRHLLAERYERAKQGKEEKGQKERTGAMPIEEMSAEDSALLEHEAANKLWQWLAGRFQQKRLTPDSDLRVDLGVDSLEWLHLTLEIGALTKVELSEKAVAEIETVRDLLRAVAESAGRGKAQPQGDPFKEPEKVLDREQKRWLEPLGPGARWAALLLFGLTRFLMRVLFHVRAQGIENLPEQGPYVLTPNHVSYLDPFALAAVLSDQQLRETYWAGWTGAAFGNWFTRAVSRLGQAVPIDPEGGIVSSLAFCAAVLKRKKNLVWFPEGMRSPTGKLLDFKPGIGTLLSHFQVPVVPVFIHGTAKAMPVGKLLPRRKRVTVVFGKPQDPSALGGRHDGEKEPERIAQALHDRVAALGK